jgi:hypothetical protein
MKRQVFLRKKGPSAACRILKTEATPFRCVGRSLDKV